MIGLSFQPEMERRASSGAARREFAPDGAPELLLAPSLGAHRAPSGNLVLTRKFLDGVARYAELWPGKVTVAVPARSNPDNNLDHQEVVPGQWPFNVLERPSDAGERKHLLERAALVVTDEYPLSTDRCFNGANYLVVTEQSLRTRFQIAATETGLGPRWLKHMTQIAWRERKLRRRLRRAAGIQCNGHPTYTLCRSLNSNVLLFFDSRVSQKDVIEDERLESRLRTLHEDRPLQLLFSGRLLRMKGAHYLPEIAAALVQRQVPFEMHICGDGAEAPLIRQRVRQLGLEHLVKLHGVLDFHEQLLPMVRDQVDLFVCPHVQGDPACTYLETLACGVPIAGYANEAWGELARTSQGGWATPMRDTAALADFMAGLAKDRSKIIAASRAARRFASGHTFEETFERRVHHLMQCAGIQT